MKFAVLIPAYCPDEKLAALVKALKEKGAAVIVVDDGSGEKYADVFDKARAEGADIVRYPTPCENENKGKGYALKTGIKYAFEHGFDEVITADADGQHAVSDILMLADEAQKNPSYLLLGSRDISKMPFKSKFGNGLTRILFRALCGIKLTDTQTGLRALPLTDSTVRQLEALCGDRYEYETNMLIHAAKIFDGIKEYQIETIYEDDNAGTHFRPIADGARIYKLLFASFPKFVIASFSSFCVDYLFFNLLVYIFKLTSVPATVIARVISATFNYLVNKNFVFKGAGKEYTIWRYAALAVFILVLNCGLIAILTEVLFIAPWIAKIIVELVLYFVNYAVQNRMAVK